MKRLLLLSGAGTSIAFGFPLTAELTDTINGAVRQDDYLREVGGDRLLDQIVENLRTSLRGGVNFEQVWQAILDVATYREAPDDPGAFDALRPILNATHQLRSEIATLAGHRSADTLLDAYIQSTLRSVLSCSIAPSALAPLSRMIGQLARDHWIWSFGLNYDDTIHGTMPAGTVTGFKAGPEPREFDPTVLLSALSTPNHVHAYLHGALRWGQPFDGVKRRLEVHEYDSASAGVQQAHPRGTGRISQRGGRLSSGTIISGLDKAEDVLHRPFSDVFHALHLAADASDALVVAGYGFADPHVNVALHSVRWRRPEVPTYVVDFEPKGPGRFANPGRLPHSFVSVMGVDLNEAFRARCFAQRPGWYPIEGFVTSRGTTSRLGLWLGGFKAFCEDILIHGELPSLR